MQLATRALTAAATLAALPALAFERVELPIVRATVEHEWPFSIDEGLLICFDYGGREFVFFEEPDRNADWPGYGPGYVPPRMVIVSVDPFALIANIEDRDLLLPFDNDLAVLIRRMAPFVTMGQRLCAGPND